MIRIPVISQLPPRWLAWLLLPCLLAPVALAASAADAADPAPTAMTLAVDLQRLPERIIEVRQDLPVAPGPVALRYPEWVPGAISIDGPVANVVGIRIRAGEAVLPWKRDRRDAYRLEFEAPPGRTSVELSFQFLVPRRGGAFGTVVSGREAAILHFDQLLFHPAAVPATQLEVAPRVTLPAGWRFAGALATRATAGTTVEFAPVRLDRLVDSPLLVADNLATLALRAGPGESGVFLNVAGDETAERTPRAAQVAILQRLDAQIHALFGGRAPASRYDFLLLLSEQAGYLSFGQQASSDFRLPADFFANETAFRLLAPLLPHEWLHAWNGGLRRPAGMMSTDYSSRPETDLLWVHEGLTDYFAAVLAARSGLWTDEYFRAFLAGAENLAAQRSGRAWRSLQDTADAARIAWEGGGGWRNWRRGDDYHWEGMLLWLDVDARIRRTSRNRRSLDDFMRAFFVSPGAEVRPYDFDDIVAALAAVQPDDWAGFLRARLDRVGAEMPRDELAAAGWKLAWTDEPGLRDRDLHTLGHGYNLMASPGILVGSDGQLRDVRWDGPAARAGLLPGMSLVAIDDVAFSPDGLLQALRTARDEGRSLRLLASDGDLYREFVLPAAEGPRFPDLLRDTGRDLLADIVRPLPTRMQP